MHAIKSHVRLLNLSVKALPYTIYTYKSISILRNFISRMNRGSCKTA